MNWLESIRSAVSYMEEHLLEENVAQNAAEKLYISPFYLQKGFRLMTGYSMGEYIRNRRLYLAALDMRAEEDKVIDIAYKYGYDTPESFTKAFTRFHGVTPTQVRSGSQNIQIFLPLKISISVQGGKKMNFVVEKMEGFQIIGFERVFECETSYKEIPQFWGEIGQKYAGPIYRKAKPEGNFEETFVRSGIGTYGVCVDDLNDGGKFRYFVAGNYDGGVVPEGMTTYELPAMEWAKFTCIGPIPGALQAVNTKIFDEWLPGNPDYEIAAGFNIEWYSKEGNTTDADYESQIWIPVKRK